MRYVIAVFLVLMGFPAQAAEGFQPAFSDQGLQLEDGGVAVFSGLDVPPDVRDAANSFLQQQGKVDSNQLLLDGAIDRYGRLQLDSFTLGMALVRAGLAYVRQPEAVMPMMRLPDLMMAEQEASKKKIGLWAFPCFSDIAAENVQKYIGGYGFVVGRVVDVVRVKNTIYLNFGDDWRKDFTVSVRAGDLKKFWPKGFDPQSYKGQTIRVRGWVERKNGGMITATSPWQIQGGDK